MGLDQCVLMASVMSNSLWPCGLYPSRLRCPWDSPGKDTGVGCHFLLQGIFLTQGSNPCLLCLLHWQVGSLPLAPCLVWEAQTRLDQKGQESGVHANVQTEDQPCLLFRGAQHLPMGVSSCRNCLPLADLLLGRFIPIQCWVTCWVLVSQGVVVSGCVSLS